MADIFISYSKQEPQLTTALARDLEQRGYSTWWDTSLLPGEEFQERIANEINKARVVIVIWTITSVSSTWVQAEAQLAAAQNKLITVRMPDLNPDLIPLPFNTRHTNLITDRQKIFQALLRYNLLPPVDPDVEAEAGGGGEAVSDAAVGLGGSENKTPPQHRKNARARPQHLGSLVSQVRQTGQRFFAIDKTYLVLWFVIAALCLGTAELLGVSQRLNQTVVSLLQPDPDGVSLQGRYLYPNYLLIFYIVMLASVLIAFATLFAAYMRRKQTQAPSREIVGLRQDIDNIIRYSNNITNYIYGGDKEEGRLDIVDAHLRYHIRPNGDTDISAVFDFHCTTDPAHFWKYWIEADPESPSVTSFRDLNFEVTDIETNQKLDWLPTVSDGRHKIFAIFFPELRPGAMKRLRITFCWRGYMNKLTDLGATDFVWRYRSQHSDKRARFRQEWVFEPDTRSIRCRLTGRQSKTASLHFLQQENRSTWIYEDPEAIMDGSQFSVEFSVGK